MRRVVKRMARQSRASTHRSYGPSRPSTCSMFSDLTPSSHASSAPRTRATRHIGSGHCHKSALLAAHDGRKGNRQPSHASIQHNRGRYWRMKFHAKIGKHTLFSRHQHGLHWSAPRIESVQHVRGRQRRHSLPVKTICVAYWQIYPTSWFFSPPHIQPPALAWNDLIARSAAVVGAAGLLGHDDRINTQHCYCCFSSQTQGLLL